MPAARPVLERLEAKSVEAPCLVKGLLPLCWVWQGSKTEQGYGVVKNGRRNTPTHRTAYNLLIEEIPEGLEPDHLCGRRDCWNPWHIEPVTHAVNVRRGRAAAIVRARAAEVTSCRYGHAYVGENDRRNHLGKRYCRACAADKRHAKSAASGYVPEAQRTHCPQNHLLDGSNLYIAPKTGARHCRECRRRQLREFRERKATKSAPPSPLPS